MKKYLIIITFISFVSTQIVLGQVQEQIIKTEDKLQKNQATEIQNNQDVFFAKVNNAMPKLLSKKQGIIPNRSISLIKDKWDRVVARYEIGWVSFEQKLNIPITEFKMVNTDDEIALFSFLENKVDFRPLLSPVITREKVENLLRKETKELSLDDEKTIQKILWSSKSNYLGIEISKEIDITNNKCVRATVNLRNGEILYREFACKVE